ncbi:alpha-hydroxy acid oxidase, partial [Frankia casuarinae]
MTALTLGDYENLARARLDRLVWDFCAGGAGEERTLTANMAAFDDVRLRPTVLRGASDPDIATRIFGDRWAAPLAVAPMAFHTLAHPDGELATVRAATSVGMPVVVSTMAGRRFEELVSAAGSPLWLQVYCFRDRFRTQRLIEHGERAGMNALVLTVDAPRLGRRLRDVRNDFRLPPGIMPVNLDGDGFSSPAAHASAELDPTLDWSVIDWLRSISSLPLLVKGILTASDAERAVR